MLARIRGFLRRQESTTAISQTTELEADNTLIFNGLVINDQTRSVTLDNSDVQLSSNEFDVLWFLAEKAGTVVSREELVSHLRGFDYDGFDRSIDLRISRLRKKLKDNASEPFRIKTIWGKGYLFAKDVW